MEKKMASGNAYTIDTEHRLTGATIYNDWQIVAKDVTVFTDGSVVFFNGDGDRREHSDTSTIEAGVEKYDMEVA